MIKNKTLACNVKNKAKAILSQQCQDKVIQKYQD